MSEEKSSYSLSLAEKIGEVLSEVRHARGDIDATRKAIKDRETTCKETRAPCVAQVADHEKRITDIEAACNAKNTIWKQIKTGVSYVYAFIPFAVVMYLIVKQVDPDIITAIVKIFTVAPKMLPP